MAEAILGKIGAQIVEDRFFEKPEEQPRTFTELMDRYLAEHAIKQAHYRRQVSVVANLKAFFGNPMLNQITPKVIVAFKNKRYADGMKPATINRALTTLKKAFNPARREWEWCQDNRCVGSPWRRNTTPGIAGSP